MRSRRWILRIQKKAITTTFCNQSLTRRRPKHGTGRNAGLGYDNILVGKETGNSEKIWHNGEMSVIAATILCVVVVTTSSGTTIRILTQCVLVYGRNV
jgi:hypothetical protein